MRILLLLLALFHGLNGLAMIAVPEAWYGAVPGVVETGPFNPHFVRDIGFGFVAAAVSLALAARRGGGLAFLWPGAVFLGGHAMLHLVEMAAHGTIMPDMIRDLALIVVPGLLPLAIPLAGRKEVAP